MGKEINVSTSHIDGVAVISIHGNVTAETWKVIASAYQHDTIADSSNLLLQFEKDCYIDSGGLAFLIQIAAAGKRREQKIHASGLSEHFKKIFHMIGLTKCIHIFHSTEDAINNF